jgi:hypothetical protein
VSGTYFPTIGASRWRAAGEMASRRGVIAVARARAH